MPFISFDHLLHTVSFFSDTLVGRLTNDFYDVPDSGVTWSDYILQMAVLWVFPVFTILIIFVELLLGPQVLIE